MSKVPEDESMKERSAPQYAKIEQPPGCDPPLVHCPICGRATFDIDEDGIEELTPCPHLAFIFSGETDGIVYMSESFGHKCDGLEFEVDDENIEEFLIRAGYGNRILALGIIYGEKDCEPVRYTDVYGFDYGTLNSEDSNACPVRCTYSLVDTVH